MSSITLFYIQPHTWSKVMGKSIVKSVKNRYTTKKWFRKAKLNPVAIVTDMAIAATGAALWEGTKHVIAKLNEAVNDNGQEQQAEQTFNNAAKKNQQAG